MSSFSFKETFLFVCFCVVDRPPAGVAAEPPERASLVPGRPAIRREGVLSGCASSGRGPCDSCSGREVRGKPGGVLLFFSYRFPVCREVGGKPGGVMLFYLVFPVCAFSASVRWVEKNMRRFAFYYIFQSVCFSAREVTLRFVVWLVGGWKPRRWRFVVFSYIFRFCAFSEMWMEDHAACFLYFSV